MDDFQTYIAELSLKEAIKALQGPTGLARALNDITPQAVSQWRSENANARAAERIR